MTLLYKRPGYITREDDIRVRNTLAKQAEVEAREKAQATPRKRRTRKS
jgi:hypothetical protein